jgi:hypothetical protein
VVELLDDVVSVDGGAVPVDVHVDVAVLSDRGFPSTVACSNLDWIAWMPALASVTVMVSAGDDLSLDGLDVRRRRIHCATGFCADFVLRWALERIKGRRA